MTFEFIETDIDDVKIIMPRIFPDERGMFFEAYKRDEFLKNEIKENFVQHNISISRKNVVRGLHYQLNPYAQGKLVSVMSGKIFDVAVDIRKNSPTFGKYISIEIDSNNMKMFWVPRGFAHGFLSLEEDTKVSYLTTNEYSHDHERGILWNDPILGINWPVKKAIVSERDSSFPGLEEATINFTYGVNE